MKALSFEALQAIIEAIPDPFFGEKGLFSLVSIKDTHPIPTVHLKIAFLEKSTDQLKDYIFQYIDRYMFSVHLTHEMAHCKKTLEQAQSGIKQIIAISSAKGGVGKSTIAAHLAVTLAQQGAKVGLLDADVYGPSIPTLFSLDAQKVEMNEDKTQFLPIVKLGIKLMSIGLLVDPSQAMIWRGPIATRTILQLFEQTAWGNLDYLILDMPPGTGDIQLTLSQKIPMTGAVVITTPHPLSIADATRGIYMFEKVNVKILGLIENMRYTLCERCDHQTSLGTSLPVSLTAQCPVLGCLPFYNHFMKDEHFSYLSQPQPIFLEITENMTIASALAAKKYKMMIPIQKTPS